MDAKDLIEIFVAGFFVGFLIQLGIPDSGEIILNSWNILSGFLIYILTSDLHIFITVAGIIIIGIAIYFIILPLIKAVRSGVEGFAVLILGIIIGIGIAAYIRSLITSITGL